MQRRASASASGRPSRTDLVRRLQLFWWGLLATATCALPFAMAQMPPTQPPSDQAPVELIQPAATSPGTGQAPPATTPPPQTEDQQQPPPPAPPLQDQAQSQNQPKSPARLESSKADGGQKSEGAKADGSKG